MPDKKPQTPSGPDTKDLMEFYKEICANIRATDDISFKILGAVPVISALGSGALTYLKPDCQLAVPFIVLSLIFALVTVGLFMWELRNIQKCKWLIARAARVEEKLEKALPSLNGQYLPFRHFFKDELGDLAATSLDEISLSSIGKRQKFGKGKWLKIGTTEAAKLIYMPTGNLAAEVSAVPQGASSLLSISASDFVGNSLPSFKIDCSTLLAPSSSSRWCKATA